MPPLGGRCAAAPAGVASAEGVVRSTANSCKGDMMDKNTPNKETGEPRPFWLDFRLDDAEPSQTDLDADAPVPKGEVYFPSPPRHQSNRQRSVTKATRAKEIAKGFVKTILIVVGILLSLYLLFSFVMVRYVLPQLIPYVYSQLTPEQVEAMKNAIPLINETSKPNNPMSDIGLLFLGAALSIPASIVAGIALYNREKKIREREEREKKTLEKDF